MITAALIFAALGVVVVPSLLVIALCRAAQLGDELLGGVDEQSAREIVEHGVLAPSEWGPLEVTAVRLASAEEVDAL